MWPIALSCLLFLCTANLYADKRVNKYVTTLIDAKWKETPLALEAAEYLNDENPNYFWKFVDTFADNDLADGNFKLTEARIELYNPTLLSSFLF